MTKQEKYYQFIINDMMYKTDISYNRLMGSIIPGEILILYPMVGYIKREYDISWEIEDKKEWTASWEDREHLTKTYGVKGDEIGYVMNRYWEKLRNHILDRYSIK